MQESNHMNLKMYRSDIDGLRALSILAVLAFHFRFFPNFTNSGFIGVDIFFTISGFLITQIILTNSVQTGWIRKFYWRRIRRIFPALIFVLLATVVAGALIMLPYEFKKLGVELIGGSTFSSNFVYLQQLGYFDNSAIQKPLLHLWSLGIEEQFYIFWPLLIWGIIRFKINKKLVLSLITLVSLSFCIYFSTSNPSLAFYSPFSRAWQLAVGGLAAIYYLDKEIKKFRFIGLIGFMVLVFSFFVIDGGNNWPGFSTVLPTLGTLLMLLDGSPKSLKNRLLSTRLLVFIGKISFPLYLWHWPILSFFSLTQGANSFQRMSLLFLSFFLAVITYLFVEKPIKNVENFQYIIPKLSFAMCFVILCGFVIAHSNGFPQRIRNSSYLGESYNPSQQFEPIAFQDQACLDEFPNGNARNYKWWFCRLSSTNSPTVLLWGNSFANQYYEGLAQNKVFRNQSILSIGDCSIQRDRNLPKSNPCFGPKWDEQQKFVKSIIANTPTLKYVIIAGLKQRPSSQDSDDLRSALGFLENTKLSVIVYYPHLTPEKSVYSCIDRPLFAARWNCEESTTIRDTLSNNFQTTIKIVHEEFPSVLAFDPNGAFCDDNTCRFLRNGIPLLRDRAPHMSTEGSILVSQEFAKWAKVNLPQLTGITPSTI